jgi:ATP-binding cassette subfamily D (ALD) long-chain fatty acid import protein
MEKMHARRELEELQEKLAQVDKWKARHAQIESELAKVWVEGGELLAESEGQGEGEGESEVAVGENGGEPSVLEGAESVVEVARGGDPSVVESTESLVEVKGADVGADASASSNTGTGTDAPREMGGERVGLEGGEQEAVVDHTETETEADYQEAQEEMGEESETETEVETEPRGAGEEGSAAEEGSGIVV